MTETEKLKTSDTTHLGPSKGTEQLGVVSNHKMTFQVSFTKEQKVADRYRVISQFGYKSGEALIYFCEDEHENRHVVLKLYQSDFKPKEDILRLLTTTSNPNIIKVYSYAYIQDQLYEVMEYIEGGSLEERANQTTFKEDELQKAVIPEVCNALKFLHSKNIIHRDIKPSNIFYKDKERKDIVVGDFGISSVLEHGLSKRLTKGALTVDFAAPELFGVKGMHYVSMEADYYALGITLIWLYLGKSPFDGLTDTQIMTKHTSDRIIPPDSMSDKFKALISGLLVKERKRRWGAHEIELWLKGENVQVHLDDLMPITAVTYPSYKLPNAEAKNPAELAILLQTYPDQGILKDRLRKQTFSKWLYSFEQNKGDEIFKVEEKTKDLELALIEISCRLNKEVPYYLTPIQKADSPQALAKILDSNKDIGTEHFKSQKIHIWLKYAEGGTEILSRWYKYSSSKSDNNIDLEFESFLHCLDPMLPEAQLVITPNEVRNEIIECTSKIKKSFDLKNIGPRGLFACSLRLKDDLDGINLKNTSVTLLKDQSSLVELEVDATEIRPGQTLSNSIILTKHIETFRHDIPKTIMIPLLFIIDYPAYAKRKAKRPLNV
jgi:serine/threonine protein kinase